MFHVKKNDSAKKYVVPLELPDARSILTISTDVNGCARTLIRPAAGDALTGNTSIAETSILPAPHTPAAAAFANRFVAGQPHEPDK
jgi:hypothetical protein